MTRGSGVWGQGFGGGRPRLSAAGRGVELVDHFLARAVFDPLRFRVAKIKRGAEELHRLAQGGRWLGLHEHAKFSSGFVHGVNAEAHGHALVRAKCVDRDGKGETTPLTVGFSMSRALPPPGDFISRSASSVISNSVAIGCEMRRSSPARSSALTQSRKDSNAMR